VGKKNTLICWESNSDPSVVQLILCCGIIIAQCVRKYCALRLRYVDLVVSIEVAVAVCCCSLYSVVNTFRPHGVYILRGLSSHQSGAL
jgi:hypothetical protein